MRKGREGKLARATPPRTMSPPDRAPLHVGRGEGKVDKVCHGAQRDGMATMNISLPDDMKAWVEAQAATGRYGNSSDVVRDLVRREQDRQTKIANMKRLVEEGRASGIDPRSMEEIMADIRANAAKRSAGERSTDA